ncbi:MAG: hypothetical protein ACOYM3_02475 [Terrimicrobiaceae bacterium]
MAEPKKETVRIVLPARRDGTPVASSPRETAMINLPPKPVPVPGGAPAAPAGLRPPVSMPSAPSAPKPPSIPSIPKPPSALGSIVPPAPSAPPSIPRPPAATVPPMAPKPPTPPSTITPPPAPAAPSTFSAPKPPVAPTAPIKPLAPAPLQGEAKKETAKVPASTPGSKVMPQATVQFQKKPDASVSKSLASTSAITVAGPAGGSASSDLSPVLGIAALVIALLSLGVQVLMWVS